MSSNAFAIQGNTVEMDVTSTTHSTIQVSGGGPGNMNYILTNTGSNTVWVAYALPATVGGAAPTVTVVAPTDGSPANGYPVLAGSKESVTGPPNAYFSAICAAGLTSKLYITPGEGE